MTELTPLDRYIITRIHQYPTLYAGKTYFEARLKILDQLLNVIGNGVRDDWELKEQIQFNPDLTMTDIECYVSGKPLFYGYTAENCKTETIGEGEDSFTFTSHSGDPEDFYITSEAEKADHPEIVDWMESSMHPFTPYPNFQSKYSTIDQCPTFMKLDDSWIVGALEFYEYCHKWMHDSKKVSKYSSAFPCATERETNRRTADMKRFLSDEKYKTNADISKAYECEFRGSRDNDQDVHDFQVRRWKQEKKKILRFMRVMIGYLTQEMVNRHGLNWNQPKKEEKDNG